MAAEPRDGPRELEGALWLGAALAYLLPALALGAAAPGPLTLGLPAAAALVLALLGARSRRRAPRGRRLPFLLAAAAPVAVETALALAAPERASGSLVPLALLSVFVLPRAPGTLAAIVSAAALLPLPLLTIALAGGRLPTLEEGALALAALLLGGTLRRDRLALGETLRGLRSDLEQRSVVDHLTGVLNRASFEARAPETLWLCALRDAPASLLRLDIDRLKRLNERLGYAAGDTLIRQIGELLRHQVRQGDLVARLGGGDFVALLPGASLDAALRVAERIRRECEKLSEPAGCTVSAGVAQRHRDEPLAELLARADAALERAKRLGRNRVEISTLEAHA
ncbi:MAG: GGDEF domain-containing protein [Xanthomonadales bacterium]|nr:GGDEF domain-containing protein [Xanthomonadales bacterium]